MAIFLNFVIVLLSRIAIFFCQFYWKLLDIPPFTYLRDYFYRVKSIPNPNKRKGKTLDIVNIPSVVDGSWESGYVSTNSIELFYVEAGKKTNPLMLLLHGFPENWFSWRFIIPKFSDQYHVVAIDMRGYNLSDKPTNKNDYKISLLVDDVIGVIKAFGYQRCVLVSHDWGGLVSWHLVDRYPQYVSHFIAMNIPHPIIMNRFLKTNATQIKRSYYMFLFQLPFIGERIIHKYRQDFASRIFKNKFQENRVSQAEVDVFVKAVEVPGALTATINYYRNITDADLLNMKGKIKIPVLEIWGERDIALGKEMVSVPYDEYVENFSVKFIPNATHNVQQDQPTQVSHYMKLFLQQNK